MMHPWILLIFLASGIYRDNAYIPVITAVEFPTEVGCRQAGERFIREQSAYTQPLTPRYSCVEKK